MTRRNLLILRQVGTTISAVAFFCLSVPTADGVSGPPDTFKQHGEQGRVQPYSQNRHYFAWEDTPVFPLGATGYHSWTPISRPGTVDFVSQLDRLDGVIEEIDSPHVCGFVRALPYDPMNHLHDGAVERVLQPWARLEDGRYDLNRFVPEWEKRLEQFLESALERRIMVSLELWDDWSVTRGPGGQYDPGSDAGWNAHPFNPKNNINYGEEVLPVKTAVCNAPFYSTVPARENIQPVLRLQKLYVERVLEIADSYPHVYINLSNESRAHLDWSRFWAEYVRERIPEEMMVAEMPSTRRDSDKGQCDPQLNPKTLAADPNYDVVDVAQAVSGHSFGSFREQAIGGGKRIATYREVMEEADAIKPIVVSKDYARASDGGNLVLWGRFMGGAAAARFHRLGVDHGEAVIEFQHGAIVRLGNFISKVPFWRMHPAPELLGSLPGGIGANVLAERGRHVVIQLVGDAEDLEVSVAVQAGGWNVRWLDPATGQTIESRKQEAKQSPLTLEVPGSLPHRILHIWR